MIDFIRVNFSALVSHCPPHTTILDLYLTENSKLAGGLVGSQSERKAEVSNLFLGSRTREPQELGNSME